MDTLCSHTLVTDELVTDGHVKVQDFCHLPRRKRHPIEVECLQHSRGISIQWQKEVFSDTDDGGISLRLDQVLVVDGYLLHRLELVEILKGLY